MQTQRLTGWRRIATTIWPAPKDPQIFGQLDIDATRLLDFIATAKLAGHHITPAHLVARALACALEAVPELNVRLCARGARPREAIEIFFITAVFGTSADLSGVKVDMTCRTVFDVARELRERVDHLRAGSDREFERSKQLMDALPPFALRAALRIGALLTERFQWDVPVLALHRSPFGSAMISSVGSIGLPQGFAPLSWLYDVPVLVLVGEITERAVVVEGKVAVRQVLPLSFTIDHRYVDGSHLRNALRALRAYLEAPAEQEPELPADPATERSTPKVRGAADASPGP